LIIRLYFLENNIGFSFEVELKSFLIRPLLSRHIGRCYNYSGIKFSNIKPLPVKCKNFISDRLVTVCFLPFAARIPEVLVGFGGILRVYFSDRKNRLHRNDPSLRFSYLIFFSSLLK